MSSVASVRVCARFRPVNSVEKSENARVCISIPQDSQVDIRQSGKEPKKFFLDHIFPPGSEQEKVYEYTGRPLMTEILKGYNGTMFAYGQTGSGKTFTMEGDMESERFMGLIPRMVNAIFEGIMDAEDKEFVVKVSYVEIYCEKIQDLLDVGNSNLQIRESSAKGIYIQGVTSPCVGSSDDIMVLMEEGADSRACASTRMNETSSRSHAVFIFRLIGTDKATQTKKMSKLMMVDLAGSEKTRKTQARGQRLDEAKQINKSLSTLGQVINALTSGKGHVPYRNSKLTRLLSDSLGGNSKTCIIVTCSPCDYNVEETISTLRFGVNCKRVKNKPKVNEELSIAEYKALIEKKNSREMRLLQKIAVLQSQVAALKEALTAAGGSVEEALKNAEQDMAVAALEEKKTERLSNQEDHLLNRSPEPPNVVKMSLAELRSNAAFEMLTERVDELEVLYNQECEDKERYMDEAADVRAELEQAEQRIMEIEEEKLELVRKMKLVDENIMKLSSDLGESRMKETKIELSRNEIKLEVQRLRQENNQLNYQLKQASVKAQEAEVRGVSPSSAVNVFPLTEKEKSTLEKYNPAKLDFEKEDEKDNIEKNYQELYKQLLIQMNTIREMMADPKQKLSKLNIGIGSVDVTQSEEILKLVTQNEQMTRKIRELKEKDERKTKSLHLLDKQYALLRKNWGDQLKQMEQAVKLATQIHNKDRIRFTSELADKESELNRLKRRNLRNKRKKRLRANNVMVPVDHIISAMFKTNTRRSRRGGSNTVEKSTIQGTSG
jgi:kinesin family protein 5